MSIEKITRRDMLKGAAALGVTFGLSRVLGVSQAEASITPEDLPSHITYIQEAAAVYDGASKVSVLLKKGDILLLMGQKLGALGNTYDTDPTKHPEQTMVIAVGAASDTTVSFQTFDGIYARSDREKTSRLDFEALIEDIQTAGSVQISRTRIPGNCIPAGCAATRFIAALAHNDGGVVRYDLIGDRVDVK